MGSITRTKRWAASVACTSLLMLAACGGDDDGNDSARPTLDLMNLRAETDTGTIDVVPIENSFVGPVDDDTFIAIAVNDADEQGAHAVTAYVCDDDYGVWLRGTLNDDGFTTLGSFEQGAYLEFTHDGTSDEIVGIVTVGALVRRTFSATIAEGDAGLYRAEQPIAGDTFVHGWIVLPDGEQRGSLDGKGNDVFIQVH